MAHVLIAGITESGKSTLARALAGAYQKAHRGVIVLDPIGDPRWPAEVRTTDPAAFLDTARRSWECALFVDEAGAMIGRYNEEMFWCATQARHLAHRAHFITQRPAQLAKTVRDQCTRLCLFQVSRRDAETLADEWNKPELDGAVDLQQGQFFDVQRFRPVVHRRLF